VPTNTGDVAMGRSGLANERNFVTTNPNTLQSTGCPDIFVLGDATDLPSPKSSLVARFQAGVLTENIIHHINGDPRESQLDADGERDRFITSASGKRFHFNRGLGTRLKKYRLPVLGPFLTEAPSDQFRALALRWIYGTNSSEAWRCRELAIS
jgi:sulfide:quinone oxidoreductase